MNYTVLKESDLSKIVPMFIRYYNQYENGAWTETTAAKRIHQVVTREDSYGLVLWDGAEAAGFAMGYFEQYDDGQAYDLVEIVLAKEYQGKGTGTAFMQELERRVKKMGALLIQLDSVNDEMHSHFYGKLGFQNCSNLVEKSKFLG